MQNSNSDLLYSPPVRGKIGTLHKGSFLFVDIFLLIGGALVPQIVINKMRSYASTKLAKILLQDQGVTNRQITFTDSGTSALALALRMGGLQEGEEVYFSANTCESVARAVIGCGGAPVFLGVTAGGSTDLSNFTEHVNRANGRAIILTNTYGLPEDIDVANRIAGPLKLAVINDLAQVTIFSKAFAQVCQKSSISVVSFGPEKYLSCLGGGAVIYSKEFSPPSITGSQTLRAVLNIFIERVKYYLTFAVFGTILYPMLRLLRMTFDLRSEKDIDMVEVGDITEPAIPNGVVLFGVLVRALILRRRAKKEKHLYSLLCRQVNQRFFVVQPSKDYIPPTLLIRARSGSRFLLAQRLARKKFQTTWNYIPLYMIRPFRKYRTTGTSDLWRVVLQVPFRFLSEGKIKGLAAAINDAV